VTKGSLTTKEALELMAMQLARFRSECSWFCRYLAMLSLSLFLVWYSPFLLYFVFSAIGLDKLLCYPAYIAVRVCGGFPSLFLLTCSFAVCKHVQAKLDGLHSMLLAEQLLVP